MGNNEMVSETIMFKWNYSQVDSSMINIYLTNTQDTYNNGSISS